MTPPHVELGRRAREDALKQVEIANKGFRARQELSKEGKLKRDEKLQRLDELEKQKSEADLIKSEKEEAKKDAEEAEKSALDQYRDKEEEKKKAEEEIERQKKDKQDSLEAFIDLDVNGDDKLTPDEIIHKWVFDSDKDGVVSEVEAKFFLNNKDEMEREEFFTIGWMLMKPHYSQLKLFENPPTSEDADVPEEETSEKGYVESEGSDPPEAPVVAEGYAEEDDENEDFDEEDEEGATGTDVADKNDAESADGEEPAGQIYDEETQRLVNEANAIRSQFEEAKKTAEDLDNEIRDLKKYLELDFGEDNQFAPLHRQCFEYTDREYTYKLCLFEQSSQRPKAGGSEINLGTWDKWNGAEDNKYGVMQYSNGLGCWSGPHRATEVRLSCGTEHKITSVTEPNRCIYVFEFESPTVCHTPSGDPTLTHGHEEL